MSSKSYYLKQILLFLLGAFVLLQGIDTELFTSNEKELAEKTEEVCDPFEYSIFESKRANVLRIKRPFNGFLYQKIATSELIKNIFDESGSPNYPKIHLRNRVFLI
ncbi:MAG: hypothetical protein HYZ44_11850 [Bacteroidetes bacterium]|nr:hypothetical protein [Bacteroidota bacterium]